MAASPPPPPTTVRRNPPRRARPPPTPAPPSIRSAAKPKPPPVSRVLDLDQAEAPTDDSTAVSPPLPSTAISPPLPSADAAISFPPPSDAISLPIPSGDAASTITTTEPPPAKEERLKVYLRIRLLPVPEREHPKVGGRPRDKEPRRPKQPGGRAEACLVATGANSVALTVPQSKLAGLKQGRTEVFDGFSAVFPPDSSQHDIFTKVMNPLVDEFLGGKSGLLVAMGPTGSGKTHTVFGSARNPGIVPLTLQKIFSAIDESDGTNQPTRSFCFSMFEILSEGKAERIIDLLSDAADLVLRQSTIKGLKEVTISNFVDAEILVSRGMIKRSTAATNANSESSRSQCIITIRAVRKSIDGQSEDSISSSVLTIADLAGAERKRSTGNQGSRLLESNFINNTSMVFGQCLRCLLDHQKNRKKTLEKHFKNSLLTRYLRDYLEGRKKMTLILNVKPGNDDYSDTSYLLRQASPYMKINYTNLEDSSDLVSQKRSNASLIWQENKKKRKVQKPEVLVVESNDTTDKDDDIEVSKREEFLNFDLRRVSRSEEIMKNLFRALWTVSKQYRLESENAAKSMRELLRDKDDEIMRLKKELNELKSCSGDKFLIAGNISVEKNGAVSSSQGALSFVSQSNQTDPSTDTALDNLHPVVEEVSEESTCYGTERSSAYCDMKGEFDDCDASVSNLIDEQELCSIDLKISTHVVDKEMVRLESCSEQTSEYDGGVLHASSHLDHPSDQSFTEHHILPCIKGERASLSPHFTDFNEKAPKEQSEQDELSNITAEDIRHVDIKELKHHNCPSFSHQASPDAEDVSSSHSFLECEQMGAVQQNPQERDTEPERCDPTVEETISGFGCGEAQNVMNEDGGIAPHVLNERPSQTKSSIAPTKDCEAEGMADRNKDLSASRPCNEKKPKRRLLPVASMMLKEFTCPDMDADTRKVEGGGGKPAAAGRSDKLLRLLKSRPGSHQHH